MKNENKKGKMGYRKALALLGVAATVAYAAPSLTLLGEAHASGGNGGGFFGNGGFFGMGEGGGRGGMAGFGSGGGGTFFVNDQATVKECGDCHMVYGPEALPQGSWRRIMGNLSNHFGEDASLDETTRRHIENYLVSNSVPGDGPLRITEQRWFVSEHRGEVSSFGMQRAKSMSNCEGCHGGGGSRNNSWQSQNGNWR